jgi:hypothetical protein
VAVVRRFFGHLAASTRLNLALNIALFVNFVVVVFTGIMISREALPVLGISLAGGHAWEGIHRQAADLILFVAGLHVAIHWKGILSATRRYLVAPVYGLLHRPAFAAPTGPAIVVARQEVK